MRSPTAPEARGNASGSRLADGLSDQMIHHRHQRRVT
jgi:hypothetical protein